MQKNDVIDFLDKIDNHIALNHQDILGNEKFKLKLIGKCALLLSGMIDTRGTVDMDSLQVEGHPDPQINNIIVSSLLSEFGREKQIIHGYYLEFVPSSIVFFPSHPKWCLLEKKWNKLVVEHLHSNDTIASKCFSAFSIPPRKKDRQDITGALDQKIAEIDDVIVLADQIFKSYFEDARSDRFPVVYKYITEELIPNYGGGPLNFQPEEE